MKKLLSLAVTLLVLTGPSAFAASGTWNASPTDGNWVTIAQNNWSTGASTFPGSTSSLSNTDIATFVSSSTTAITINSTSLNIKGITFGTSGSALSAFTIGSTGGNSIFLSAGTAANGFLIGYAASTTTSGVVETVNAPLVLEGTYAFQNLSTDTTNVLNIGGTITNGSAGAITLSLGSGTNNNAGQNIVSGVISDGTGAGATTGISVSAGTWGLSGANTFSGGVNLGRATLDINNAAALGTGTFTIANASIFDNTSSGAIALSTNNAISLGGAATFTGTQSLNLGTGAVTLTGNGGFTVNANTLTVGGIISGAHNFSKGGVGTLVFTGANAYSGTTTISAGILSYQNATAFGANSAILVSSGGTAQVQGGLAGGSQTLTLNGTGASGTTGALESISGSNSYAGAIILGTTPTISVDAGTLTLTGNFASSANALTKAGNGTLSLNGANGSYTGATVIGAGTVLAGSATALGTNTITLGNAATTTNNSSASVLTNGAYALANAITIANQATSGTYTLGGNTDNNSSLGAISDGQSFTVTQVATSGSNALTIGGIRGSGANADTITFANAGAVNVSGNIINATTGGGTNAVTQSGPGTTTISTSGNTYTGATLVAGGKLNITGTVSASAVTVGNNTSTAAILSGTGTITQSVTTATTGGNIAYIAPGVNISGARTDFGSAGTLKLGAAGLTLGDGTNLDFDLASATTVGGGVNDLIQMAGGTLTLGGVTTFNYNALGSLTTGVAYTLIDGATLISGFNALDFSSTGLAGMTATYSTSGGNLLVTFTASGSPATAYFTGSASGDMTSASNYVSSPTGGTISGAPGATTDVYITANTGTTGANALTPNTNTAALSIQGLTFTGTGTPATAGATVSGSNALTTGTDGITVQTGAGNDTISAPVVLGASQSWTVTDASNTLTVSGGVSGTGSQLTKAGAGSVALTGNNTYTGGTIISAGTLYANNATSSTGTGAVTVSSGGTLAGIGAIAPTGGNGITVNNGGILAPGSGQSVPYAGTPGTVASTGLTVSNAAPVTFDPGAKLTFALGAGGSSSAFSVLGSTVTFGGNVVTINDLVGAGLTINGEYTLFAGDGSTVYDGLTYGAVTSNGKLITGGLSLLVTSPGTNFFADWYGASQLYLNGDNIVVDVVPEPGTWAMMFGGFALLLVYQRRRRS